MLWIISVCKFFYQLVVPTEPLCGCCSNFTRNSADSREVRTRFKPEWVRFCKNTRISYKFSDSWTADGRSKNGLKRIHITLYSFRDLAHSKPPPPSWARKCAASSELLNVAPRHKEVSTVALACKCRSAVRHSLPVKAFFFVGSLFDRTCWSCLSPPLRVACTHYHSFDHAWLHRRAATPSTTLSHCRHLYSTV